MRVMGRSALSELQATSSNPIVRPAQELARGARMEALAAHVPERLEGPQQLFKALAAHQVPVRAAASLVRLVFRTRCGLLCRRVCLTGP